MCRVVEKGHGSRVMKPSSEVVYGLFARQILDAIAIFSHQAQVIITMVGGWVCYWGSGKMSNYMSK